MISIIFNYICLMIIYQVWAQWSVSQSYRTQSANAQSSYSKSLFGDVVDLKIYYESHCPACQHELCCDLPLISTQLGNRVNIELVPYGKCQTCFANGTWIFDAQHGPEEAYGNKLHNCALNMLDAKTAMFFNACIMGGPGKGSNDVSVDQCAARFGINGEAIKQCAKSIRGSLLLKAAGEKTPRITQVPYAIINGVPDLGNLFEGVCKAFVNPPPVCASVK